MKDHRKFVYDHYVSSGDIVWSPVDLKEIEQRAHYFNKIIEKHFPQDRSINIIDLGCGYGAFVHVIRLAGYYNVMGIDTALEQIAVAKRLGIEGVGHGDIMDTLFDLQDVSQDIVITFDVIEHFTKDELISLGCEVYRVLRSGGKWIIHTPNGEALFCGRSFFGDFTHQTNFTRNSIAQFLKSVGFAQVVCDEDRIVVHGFKSALRWVLWGMTVLVLRVILTAETGNWDRYLLTQNFLTVGTKIQEPV